MSTADWLPDPKTAFAPAPRAGERGDVAQAGAELPSIYVNNRQMRDYSDKALEALQADNDPPFLFVRSGQMVAMIRDEKQRQVIDEVGESALRGRMARSATY